MASSLLVFILFAVLLSQQLYTCILRTHNIKQCSSILFPPSHTKLVSSIAYQLKQFVGYSPIVLTLTTFVCNLARVHGGCG